MLSDALLGLPARARLSWETWSSANQAVTVASQGLDGAPRGTEVLLQLARILVCILFLQHAVMQKPRLVFKQLVYVTANTSQ